MLQYQDTIAEENEMLQNWLGDVFRNRVVCVPFASVKLFQLPFCHSLPRTLAPMILACEADAVPAAAVTCFRQANRATEPRHGTPQRIWLTHFVPMQVQRGDSISHQYDSDDRHHLVHAILHGIYYPRTHTWTRAFARCKPKETVCPCSAKT